MKEIILQLVDEDKSPPQIFLFSSGDSAGNSSTSRVPPSVQLRLSIINNSVVYNGGRLSEPILLIGSQVINSIVIPRAEQQGIRFINSTLNNLTLPYDGDAHVGSLEITGSNVTNIIATFGVAHNYFDGGSCVVKVQRSSIRNASFLFVPGYWQYVTTNFTFDDSTLNNILINATSHDSWNSYDLY
jgi:hypothetical protein